MEEAELSDVSVIGPTGWATGESAIFGVLDRADGRFLAAVSLGGIAESPAVDGGRASIGYLVRALGPQCRVTTDAARLVCTWGFEGLRLARIDWYAEVGNDPSRRVAEKLGFVIEGVQRLRLVHIARRRDAWASGLLRRDLR